MDFHCLLSLKNQPVYVKGHKKYPDHKNSTALWPGPMKLLDPLLYMYEVLVHICIIIDFTIVASLSSTVFLVFSHICKIRRLFYKWWNEHFAQIFLAFVRHNRGFGKNATLHSLSFIRICQYISLTFVWL